MLLQTIHQIVLSCETELVNLKALVKKGDFYFKEIVDSHKSRLDFIIFSKSFHVLILLYTFSIKPSFTAGFESQLSAFVNSY